MAATVSPTDKAKQLAGYKAVDDHVTSGMVVGLGTGSTAYFAVERVGQKLASGELKDIICIPTSERTREQAESLKIPLCTLNEKSELDVAIDGADAVDPNLALVKGGGGALLREKMVEVRSKKFICIVDDSKLCKGLGPSFALPVEITPFCHLHTLRTIAALPEVAGSKAVLRTGDVSNNKPDGDKPAVTDNGNYIVDLSFDTPIRDVRAAAKALKGVRPPPPPQPPPTPPLPPSHSIPPLLLAVIRSPERSARARGGGGGGASERRRRWWQVVGVVDHGLFVDMVYQVRAGSVVMISVIWRCRCNLD